MCLAMPVKHFDVSWASPRNAGLIYLLLIIITIAHSEPYNLRIYFRYNEVCSPGYKFYAGSRNRGTGHFTQVVWKESTVLGIGRAESVENGMKCAYIVGRYKPAGNFIGEYRQNVPKGSFDANTYCATIDKNGFDQGVNIQDVIIGKSRVDSPVQKTGSAEFRGQRKHK